MLRSHPILPFLAAATGIFTFSLMDGLMKSASLAVGVYSAMLIRSAFGALMMLPVWRLAGGRWPGRPALKVHALRAAVSAVMASSFFWGLVRLPIAEAIAISFIAPLIALYLAAVMLGERIQRKAVFASLLGFAGVLVIAAARIGDSAFTPEMGWGIASILFSAVLYAWNIILQRQQAQVAGPREIAFFQTFFVASYLSIAAPWLLVLPAPEVLRELIGSSALTVISLMFLSWAYARAEAQVLLPIEYTAFVWGALVGWWWFGEAVTLATVLGVILIIAACWIAAPRRTEQTAL
jgi:S-adenosylmethionine uptake transporter